MHTSRPTASDCPSLLSQSTTTSCTSTSSRASTMASVPTPAGAKQALAARDWWDNSFSSHPYTATAHAMIVHCFMFFFPLRALRGGRQGGGRDEDSDGTPCHTASLEKLTQHRCALSRHLSGRSPPFLSIAHFPQHRAEHSREAVGRA